MASSGRNSAGTSLAVYLGDSYMVIARSTTKGNRGTAASIATYLSGNSRSVAVSKSTIAETIDETSGSRILGRLIRTDAVDKYLSSSIGVMNSYSY